MPYIIPEITLLIGIGGMLFIAAKKIPVLVKLPESKENGDKEKKRKIYQKLLPAGKKIIMLPVKAGTKAAKKTKDIVKYRIPLAGKKKKEKKKLPEEEKTDFSDDYWSKLKK